MPLQSQAANSAGRPETWRAIGVPTDRRLAVLGQRRSGKTTLLKSLSGKPGLGLARPVQIAQFSPVANAGGLFHPKLNVNENIRFLADLYGVEPRRLAAGILEFCALEADWSVILGSNDPALRRSLEVAAVMFLPFGCYLIDDAGHLPSDIIDRCFEMAKERRAGVIFSTSNVRLARQRADCILVVAKNGLQLFDDVEKGIAFFGQYKD
jgi:capsular polysaccharide transport system ATP-binding protein